MKAILFILILAVAALIFAVNLHYALLGYYPDLPYVELFEFF